MVGGENFLEFVGRMLVKVNGKKCWVSCSFFRKGTMLTNLKTTSFTPVIV